MVDPKDEGKLGRGYGTGYSILSAGFALPISILFFAWMGYLADRKLGTAPLLLLIGLGIGLGAGFYAFWRKISAESKAGSGVRGPGPGG
ncbi:MAG: AtpZ/AtpI family protein [Gemmatimonadales bacterium]|nr:AtpZ/AtpI family protein [Gemmatimonadales bacterium]